MKRFTVSFILTIFSFSFLFISPAHALVAIDEVVDPTSGNRIVIFGEVHTDEIRQLAIETGLENYLPLFFRSMMVRTNIPSKKDLILVEVRETQSVDAGTHGFFHAALEQELKKGLDPEAIEIRKGDLRMDVSLLPELYAKIFDTQNISGSAIITKVQIKDLMRALLKCYEKAYEGRFVHLLKTATALKQFETYLLNIQNLKTSLHNMNCPVPDLFKILERNIILLIDALKKYDEEYSGYAFINLPFDIANQQSMTMSELRESFQEFFNLNMDFLYADANYYVQTLVDQKDPNTKTTFLFVGDAHREKLTQAFLNVGYKDLKSFAAFTKVATSNGIGLAINQQKFARVCFYLPYVGLYLKHLAEGETDLSFLNYCDARLPVEEQDSPLITDGIEKKVKESEACINACGKPACGKTGTKRCNGCKAISYCSVDCQKAHWPSHRDECLKNRNK